MQPEWTQKITVAISIILAWISNYIHYTMWDEITYKFPNIAAPKFGNEYIISFHKLQGICLRIHAGITVDPC